MVNSAMVTIPISQERCCAEYCDTKTLRIGKKDVDLCVGSKILLENIFSLNKLLPVLATVYLQLVSSQYVNNENYGNDQVL